MTYKGDNLEYNKLDVHDPNRYLKNGEYVTYQQGNNSVARNTKSNFCKEIRFKEAPLFCTGTGESVYTGPGSYFDHEKFLKQTKKPCNTVMKNSSYLPKEESKKQCYVMVGQ
jgi:hypothetical protein